MGHRAMCVQEVSGVAAVSEGSVCGQWGYHAVTRDMEGGDRVRWSPMRGVIRGLPKQLEEFSMFHDYRTDVIIMPALEGVNLHIPNQYKHLMSLDLDPDVPVIGEQVVVVLPEESAADVRLRMCHCSQGQQICSTHGG